MIELMFPSGETINGDTYRECEDTYRATQLSIYPSRRAFRRELRKRAVLWGGKGITFLPVQTSKQFLTSLAKTGMLRIDKSTEGTLS